MCAVTGYRADCRKWNTGTDIQQVSHVDFDDSGNLKRESEGFTYLSPDGISYVPYNGDNRDGWYIPYPSQFDYSKAREFLAKGSNLSDAYTWLGVFPKAEVLWPDVEPWNQYNKNERGHGFQYMGR